VEFDVVKKYEMAKEHQRCNREQNINVAARKHVRCKVMVTRRIIIRRL